MPRLSDSAREVAFLLSLCPEKAAPWHLLEALLEEQSIWDGCQQLAAAGYMVSLPSRGGPLRLTQDPQNLRGARLRQLQKRYFGHLLQVCKEIPAGAGLREGALWLDYLPQLESLITTFLSEVPDAELGWPFVALARLCEAQADRPRAMYWSARALAVLQARLGPSHLDTATAYNNLAAAYHQAGHYPQAEELYAQALRIREQQLGTEHPHLVTVLSNLAGACRSQNKLEFTLAYLERASSIAGRQSLPVLLQLVEACSLSGDLDRALSTCRVALAQCQPDQPQRAFILQSLGSVWHKLGQLEQAHACFEQALQLHQAHLGQDHPVLGGLLNNWGVLFYLEQNWARCEQLLARALEIRLQSLGPRNPETRATAANLSAARQRLQQSLS